MYTFTIGFGSELLGINNDGEMVGDNGGIDGGPGYTFLYSDGTFTTIDVPAGGSLTGGINDAGQLVGIFTDSTGSYSLLDSGGTFTTFADPSATVSNGETATEAYGINDAGQIVGTFFGPGYWNSFLDTNGTFTTITDPVAYFNGGPSGNGTISGGGTFATGINDAGQIVGYYFDSQGATFGFVDTDGSFVTISDPSALTSHDGYGTIVSGINDAGQVVGTYTDSSGVVHGFLDTDGVFTTIDVPGAANTQVTGINDQGDIVGYAGSEAVTTNPFYPSDNGPYGFEATPMPCFLRGTRIATPFGEVPVEKLAIGDLVRAQDARLASIKWIGHRGVDCRNHPRPEKVWPVRVRAGAFGDDMPRRDLWLSLDHAVFVDGVLIPIKRLINGASIEQVPIDEVAYYHVELEYHDVLLAEGLPAESYLDTGDRCNFENGGGPIALHPEFSARKWDTALRWEALGCARLIVTGPELDATRHLVNSRAAAVARAACAA